MFIKEVSLKRNGLSWKLYHFVFPWAPRYDNYCPFFWLTILAGILFPIIFPFWLFLKLMKFITRLVIWGMDFVGNKFENFVTGSLEKCLFSLSGEDTLKFLRYRENLYDNDIYVLPVCEKKRFEKIRKLYWKLYRRASYDVLSKLEDKVKKEKVKFDWDLYIKQLQDKQEAYEKKQLLEDRRREERIKKIEQKAKNTANHLIPFAKVISVIILIPVAAFVCWKLILLLGWIWYWIAYFFTNVINYDKLLAAIVLSLLSIFVLAILCSIVWATWIGVRKLLSSLPGKIKAPSWLCITSQWALFYVLRPLGHFIRFCSLAFWTIIKNIGGGFGKGIVSFFKFFWNIFIAWKDKNCPAIIWRD